MRSLATIQRLRKNGLLGMAIRGELGTYLSRVGDALNSPKLTYNPWTIDSFHRLAIESAPTFVDGALELYPDMRSAVDWGCGTGAYVKEFRRRDVACEGYEYTPKVREVGKSRLDIDLHPFDLGSPKPWDGNPCDLAISLEVAEHVSPELGDRLVDLCIQSAPRVIFSAAIPGQGGQGHVNEQPREYWIDRFVQRGYMYHEDRTAAFAEHLLQNLVRGLYLARNVMIFEKPD